MQRINIIIYLLKR